MEGQWGDSVGDVGDVHLVNPVAPDCPICGEPERAFSEGEGGGRGMSACVGVFVSAHLCPCVWVCLSNVRVIGGYMCLCSQTSCLQGLLGHK